MMCYSSEKSTKSKTPSILLLCLTWHASYVKQHRPGHGAGTNHPQISVAYNKHLLSHLHCRSAGGSLWLCSTSFSCGDAGCQKNPIWDITSLVAEEDKSKEKLHDGLRAFAQSSTRHFSHLIGQSKSNGQVWFQRGSKCNPNPRRDRQYFGKDYNTSQIFAHKDSLLFLSYSRYTSSPKENNSKIPSQWDVPW